MHASARWRNVSRTILVHLASLSLGGAQLVHGDDATTDTSSMAAFVRARVEPAPAEELGRLSGDVAELGRFRLVVEVYARNGEGDAVVAVDLVEGVAEAVQHALRAKALPLVDYVADATGATLVTNHVLRFVEPAQVVHAPPLAGWARRILTAPGWWVLRHSTE